MTQNILNIFIMQNLKKLSREDLKSVKGGQPVGPGVYACCKGTSCSSTVTVTNYDDLICGTGTYLRKMQSLSASTDVN